MYFCFLKKNNFFFFFFFCGQSFLVFFDPPFFFSNNEPIIKKENLLFVCDGSMWVSVTGPSYSTNPARPGPALDFTHFLPWARLEYPFPIPKKRWKRWNDQAWQSSLGRDHRNCRLAAGLSWMRLQTCRCTSAPSEVKEGNRRIMRFKRKRGNVNSPRIRDHTKAKLNENNPLPSSLPLGVVVGILTRHC